MCKEVGTAREDAAVRWKALSLDVHDYIAVLALAPELNQLAVVWFRRAVRWWLDGHGVWILYGTVLSTSAFGIVCVR
eukprot:scaffold69302_cov68-Phaeocystis_antarctica.AAC.7